MYILAPFQFPSAKGSKDFLPDSELRAMVDDWFEKFGMPLRCSTDLEGLREFLQRGEKKSVE